MRTLKRTMCLVLAMVMLLGVCSVFVSAADSTNLDKYPDKEDITYKEAVDVLSGIGVLQGDARGFRPKDNVTRAEAAKIIAYLLIGNADAADALKASVKTFTDVETTHWAAGYIAYCAERGIVKGRGNGIYDPNGNVTGIEFAKMLLCAIGYGVNDEYLGDAWAINVAKDGVQYGIYNNNLKGASETAATREECALYAFNTLELKKVTYSALLGGYIENIGNNMFNGNPNQAESNKEATIALDYKLYSNKIQSRNDYWNSYSNAGDIDSDAFYRPTGYFWYQRYQTNPVSGHYSENYLLHTYTGPVTASEIFTLIGGTSIVNRLYDFVGSRPTDAIGFRVFENGEEYKMDLASTPEIQLTNDKKALASDYSWISLTETDGTPVFTRRNANVLAHTGYGVTTSVYGITDKDGELVEIRIVLIHSYLAQVHTVNAATRTSERSVSVDFPSYDNGLVDYQPDVTIRGTKREYKLNKNTFETNDFGKDDYVLVTYSFRNDGEFNEGIQSMNSPKVINNRITSFNNVKGGERISAGGVSYYVALDDAMHSNQTSGSKISAEMVNGGSYNIFLDTNDYVIGVDSIIAPKTFVYVAQFGAKINTQNTLNDRVVLQADIYSADNTHEILPIKIDGKNGSKLMGLTRQQLADDWNLKSMNNGEAEYVAELNTLTYEITDASGKKQTVRYPKCAIGLYQMVKNSDGSVTLTDLETYAAERDPKAGVTDRNKKVAPLCVAENYTKSGTKIYRGVTGLRTVESSDYSSFNSNYDTRITKKNYELYSTSETVFFYVSGTYGKDMAVNVYIGTRNAPTTSGDKDSRELCSWYAQADTQDNSKVNYYAYAEVCLVSGAAPEETKDESDAGYIYVDYGEMDHPGRYKKTDNSDGTYTVEFKVIKATETSEEEREKTLTYTFDSSDKADAAINYAAYNLVNNWVKEGKDGLEPFVEPNVEKASKTDKVTYVGNSSVSQVTGITLYYTTQFVDSTGKPHYLGVDINSNTLISDVRLVPDVDKIKSLTQIENIVNGKHADGSDLATNENPQVVKVLIAFSDDQKANAVFIVGMGDKVGELGELSVTNKKAVLNPNVFDKEQYIVSDVVTYVPVMKDGKVVTEKVVVPKRDENGNVVTEVLRDSNGNVLTDQNGNIHTQVVYEEIEQIVTEEKHEITYGERDVPHYDYVDAIEYHGNLKDGDVSVKGSGNFIAGDTVTVSVKNETDGDDVYVFVSVSGNVEVKPGSRTQIKKGATQTFTFTMPENPCTFDVNVYDVQE